MPSPLKRSVPLAVGQEPAAANSYFVPSWPAPTTTIRPLGWIARSSAPHRCAERGVPAMPSPLNDGVERAVLQVPDDDGSFLVAGAGGDRSDRRAGGQRRSPRRHGSPIAVFTSPSVPNVGVERAAGQVASDGRTCRRTHPAIDDLAIGLDGDLVRRGTVGVGSGDLAGLTKRWIEVAACGARRCGDDGEEECQSGRSPARAVGSLVVRVSRSLTFHRSGQSTTRGSPERPLMDGLSERAHDLKDASRWGCRPSRGRSGGPARG